MANGRETVDDEHGEQRAPQAGRCDAAHGQYQVEGDRHHRPERCAGRNAERVGRGERVAQQALEDDAGRGQGAADEGGGDGARQPRDEEYLCVDIVDKRHGAVEHPVERNRRRADERRRKHGRQHRDEAADDDRQAAPQRDGSHTGSRGAATAASIS